MCQFRTEKKTVKVKVMQHILFLFYCFNFSKQNNYLLGIFFVWILSFHSVDFDLVTCLLSALCC